MEGAQGGGSRHQHVPSRWVRPVDTFGWHRIEFGMSSLA